jgi:[ribosomal protein S5]-alanine N-acetyltransferase
VPTLFETERLVLRTLELGDAPFMLALMTDPEWIRHIGDRKLRTEEDARRSMLKGPLALYRRFGFGLWLVARRGDEASLGICGLVKRPGLDDVDLGFAFLPAHRGSGYAREAALATLSHAHRALGLTRVVAIASPANERSHRVLESIGMTRAGTVRLPSAASDDLLFASHAGTEPRTKSAQSEIDALVLRFFDAFTVTADRPHQLDQLAELFTPTALIVHKRGPIIDCGDLEDFTAPRRDVLSTERAAHFLEWEEHAETTVSASLAQRRARYRKRGLVDGRPLEGTGTKLFQLVDTPRGWRIASIVWEDDVPPP